MGKPISSLKCFMVLAEKKQHFTARFGKPTVAVAAEDDAVAHSHAIKPFTNWFGRTGFLPLCAL